MRQISHDPFARTTTFRRNINSAKRGAPNCAWCGARARYEYGTQSVGLRTTIAWHPHAFCGVDCFRTYTNS